MSLAIPNKRKFQLARTYPDLDSARSIAVGNPLRGLFMLSIKDSFDATRPRRWDVLISGGTSYAGDGAKYFVLDNGHDNVVSVTVISFGFQYDLLDVFGNTYRLIFNGARGFNCTIQRTAGAALTGPITVTSLLFPFDDPA